MDVRQLFTNGYVVDPGNISVPNLGAGNVNASSFPMAPGLSEGNDPFLTSLFFSFADSEVTQADVAQSQAAPQQGTFPPPPPQLPFWNPIGAGGPRVTNFFPNGYFVGFGGTPMRPQWPVWQPPQAQFPQGQSGQGVTVNAAQPNIQNDVTANTAGLAQRLFASQGVRITDQLNNDNLQDFHFGMVTGSLNPTVNGNEFIGPIGLWGMR